MKREPAGVKTVELGGEKEEVGDIAPLKITQEVDVKTSNADRYIAFRGPSIVEAYQPLDWGDGTYYRNKTPKYGGLPQYFLKSWRDKTTGQVVHQLYVAFAYSAPAAWQLRTAQFDDASTVQVTVFGTKKVKCLSERCTYVEYFGIPVSDQFLRYRFGTGFQVYVFSQQGHSERLDVPANYLQGHLGAINRVAWGR